MKRKMQIKREQKGACPARSPSPVVPVVLQECCWQHRAAGSLQLSHQPGNQIPSLQTGLNRVIAANGITVTFLLSSSLPSEQGICILRSSEGSPIATKLRFLNTRRTLKSLWKACNMNKSQDCEVGLNPVQQDRVCMTPENQSTDLGFSFSIPQLAHETSGQAERILNTVIS